MNIFEKIIIVLILIVGLLGGVVLVYYDAPEIISSVFIAMGIATLVYHFLGGIEVAQVNTGIVKLGGSMAALIGSAIIINNLLIVQVNNPEEKLYINSNYEIFNSKNKIFGKIPLNNFHLKLNKNLIVIAEDSISMSELNLGDLKLNSNYEIKGNDTVMLGTLNKRDLTNIGILNKLDLKNYTEIKYNLRLETPLQFKIDRSLWTDVNQYEVNYQNLPFKVEPYESEKNNFKTKIKFHSLDLAEKFNPIKRDETIFVTDLYKEQSLIYLIRVRQVVKSKSWNSFDNFVQYQIIEFSGILE